MTIIRDLFIPTLQVLGAMLMCGFLCAAIFFAFMVV